jgi:hypothetical protein
VENTEKTQIGHLEMVSMTDDLHNELKEDTTKHFTIELLKISDGKQNLHSSQRIHIDT